MPGGRGSKFDLIRPLCDTCSKAVPQRCPFFRLKDPEAGLRAIGAQAVRHEHFPCGETAGYKVMLYKVTTCPGYTKGSLPPLGR
ncbi:MAG: hypothetical protein AB1374_07625 [Bacillota bacterium]